MCTEWRLQSGLDHRCFSPILALRGASIRLVQTLTLT
jgi:hypothetical protein